MKNRLAQETSPYLKQHEDNPVDWYPWGPEALERARRENKPILLSVGYSACHWCHVMAHESFENVETAKLMNEHFINVKVDREERPDLDQIYQNVAQAMNQGGGWPLTVFLTPDLRPFFGGTYFPPEDRYGRPGFPRVLLALSNAFRTEPENVEENAQKLSKIIAEIARQEEASTASGTTPTLDGLAAWAERVLAWVDGVNGGFGSAPKFPNTMMLTALWRSSREDSFPSDLRTRLADAVRLSLRKMAEGGIFDQLGGGFSRYSVDERWAVPHFEKMLYDNGLLLRLYSEVLASDAELVPELKSLFSETISKTVEYLLREMQSKDGLFYAAQDADSEGEEGKFFVWTPSELSKILSEDERTVFQLRYGVDEAGNFEHGATVLFQALPVKDVAARIGIALEKAAVLLRSAEKKVFSHREQRIRPGLDSKCLISWNGLLISGLVWASKVIEDENLAARSRIAALQAWEGVLKLARAGDGRLYSTVQEGKPKLAAYLDDYAFMARAAIDLTLAAPERAGEFFEAAEKWAVTVLDHFSDPSASGYFFTSDDHEKLIQRPKSSSDQAIPSGSSVLYQVFQVLSEWTLNSKLRERFEKEWRSQVARAYATLEKHPYGQGELFSSTLLSLQGAELWSAADVETLQTLLPRPNAWVKGIEKSIPAGQKQRCRRGVCEIVNAPNPG